MKLSQLTIFSIVLILLSHAAAAQENPFAPLPRPQNPAAGEAREEPEDLKRMKQTKWIVTNVERDGQTIPAQYGQREGDIIAFKMDEAGNTIFG